MHDITQSKFLTIAVPDTPTQGIPIGEGACKGVKLRLNAFARNAATLVSTPFYCYYGDAKSQEYELVAVDLTGNVKSTSSPFIPCTNLNQVFLRYHPVGAMNSTVAMVQVEVFI